MLLCSIVIASATGKCMPSCYNIIMSVNIVHCFTVSQLLPPRGAAARLSGHGEILLSWRPVAGAEVAIAIPLSCTYSGIHTPRLN